MEKIDFSHYHRYQELTDILKSLAESYPNLATLHSIGKTPQGRDLWVMEITNKKTGASADKPAYWIDGNTHGGEVTGREVALKTIWHLLSNYSSDPFVTDLIDTRCGYIMPAVNPDGAEIYLTTPYLGVAGGVPNPAFEDEFAEGLYEEDVNKDNEITVMRIKDPNGDWRVSEKDPRLMVKRKPEEKGGEYYRLYREGLIKNYDRKEISKTAPGRWMSGSNRNWPSNWSPSQPGQAGKFPLWEKEARAIADFFYEHKNIGAAMTYHTSGGICMRPYVYWPDEHFHTSGLERDLALFNAIGAIGEELLKYPLTSPYEGMNRGKPARRPYGQGVSLDWWYEHWGIVMIGLELWDVMGRAGLGNYRERGGERASVGPGGDMTEEQGLALLAWNDKELGGAGFLRWTPFNHPQLGAVEIGGWKSKFVTSNPPPHLLESEIDKTMMWILKAAALTPLVKITSVKSISLGEGLYKVEATVENTGFMPTYITQQAIKITSAQPVKVKIDVGNDAEVVAGKERMIIGNLEGNSDRLPGYPAYSVPGGKPEESKKTVEWILRPKKTPAKVKILSMSEKGGKDLKEIELT